MKGHTKSRQRMRDGDAETEKKEPKYRARQ